MWSRFFLILVRFRFGFLKTLGFGFEWVWFGLVQTSKNALGASVRIL